MLLRLLLRFIVFAAILFPYYSGNASQEKDFSLNGLADKYKAATSFYESKLQKNPQDINLRLKLADFYYMFHQYQRVIKLTEGIKSLKAQMLLAKAYTCLKNYDYAIEVFEHINSIARKKGIKISDNEYIYLYAYVLEHKNMFAKAVDEYKNVKGSLRKEAENRIHKIQLNVLRKEPAYIKKLARDSENFLKSVPDAAVLIQLVDESMEMTPENTKIYTAHIVEKVLKERGKSAAEVEIGYDSTYERVKLVFARTITKDGRVISVGKENIRDVSKYLNFPLYSNARAFIISMPSVEPGSVIDYKVKIYSSKLIDRDNFSFIYRLRDRYPIFKAKFKLITPIDKKVHFKYFNRERAAGYSLAPEAGFKNSGKIYKWEFKDIKPIIPEYNMPPDSEVNPAILVSSFSSWSEIYDWWKKLFSNKLELNTRGKALVDNLIKNASSKLDKAKKIYEFCAKQIRYVAVEYGESGYEPHSANEVFVNRYGDCKDQAILLTAMLRYAGFNAFPVLVPTRSVYPVDKNFPSINFNHAICALKYQGKLIFMDPTAETTSFMDIPLPDQNREVMVFGKNRGIIKRIPIKKDNGILYSTKVALSSNEKAEIERTVTTKGFFSSAQRWYFKHTHPVKIKENIQNKVVEIAPFAKLISYQIINKDNFDKSPILTYKFSSAQFLNPARNLRILPIPDDMHISYNLIAKSKRKFPIDFGGMFTKRSVVTVLLPPDLKVKYLPQNIQRKTRYFNFKETYKNEGRTITVRREFNVKKRFVSEEEYSLFKKKLEDVFFFLREKVILEKKNN